MERTIYFYVFKNLARRVPGTFEPCGKKPEPKSKAFGRGRGGKRGVGGRGSGGRGDGGSRGRGYGGGEGGDAGARTRGGITPVRIPLI